MNLSEYDQKHVRIKDIQGHSLEGLAIYGNSELLECEYGGEEVGIFIDDILIFNSQIGAIEEIEVHGTVELWTENLILRSYRPEDAKQLYIQFGTRQLRSCALLVAGPRSGRRGGWDDRSV